MDFQRNKVPLASSAFIGGSSTFSFNFPEELEDPEIEVMEKRLTFETPYGESPPFRLLKIKGAHPKKVLTCKMHGWRSGLSRGEASKQVFWVLREARVKRIISEGGVGSLHTSLKPRDLVIPHDYIDFSARKEVSLGQDFLLIMREPLCPYLRSLLIQVAKEEGSSQVFPDGIYVVSDGTHFESKAEIRMMQKWEGTVVGQSLSPEVYLAREIGACYAGIYLVVNYAEGVKEEWSYQELKEIFYGEAKNMGRILLKVLKSVKEEEGTCNCLNLRKPTLLKN